MPTPRTCRYAVAAKLFQTLRLWVFRVLGVFDVFVFVLSLFVLYWCDCGAYVVAATVVAAFYCPS